MTPELQKSIDEAILLQLDRSRTRLGHSVNAIIHLLREYELSALTDDLILDRLDYLTRKELIEEVLKVEHKAIRAWRITKSGIDFLDHRT